MRLRRIASAKGLSESPIRPNTCLTPTCSSAPTRTSETVCAMYASFAAIVRSTPFSRNRKQDMAGAVRGIKPRACLVERFLAISPCPAEAARTAVGDAEMGFERGVVGNTENFLRVLLDKDS